MCPNDTTKSNRSRHGRLVEFVCPVCDKHFFAEAYLLKRPYPIRCSQKCAAAVRPPRKRKPTVACVCLNCGKTVQHSALYVAKGYGQFCNHRCHSDYQCGKQPKGTPEERFWAKVEKQENGCWTWTGATGEKGYGQILVAGYHVHSHRFSWELHNGPVPEGLQVCHDCDKNYPIGDATYRRCVNPLHLWLGTAHDNTQDMMKKGRHRHGTTRLWGSQHPATKLVEAQVLEMRARWATGTVRLKDLAADYGIAVSSVSSIVNRYNWRHI